MTADAPSLYSFQYMLLLRGATCQIGNMEVSTFQFQYMLLLRGATLVFHRLCKQCRVSIHAPLARSNFKVLHFDTRFRLFQYMLLLRGATQQIVHILLRNLFQYMLLLRGATLRARRSRRSTRRFNTCSSCEEQRKTRSGKMQGSLVSIHAPLARSNYKTTKKTQNRRVSIHAPLARSNKSFVPSSPLCMSFNTCSSCEEQLSSVTRSANLETFQYMLLLRGATGTFQPVFRRLKFQYMLLLRGATIFLPVIVAELRFQYMLLLRGATLSKTLQTLSLQVSIHAPLARSNYRQFNALHQKIVSIHAPLARSNRGNINRSGSKCKSKNRAKYQLSFVKEHYCILRFLIIV